MKFKITIVLLILLFIRSTAFSQVDTSQVQKVKIGDKVPDYKITDLINYPTKNTKLTDFTGKILLIDFWSTSCVSCIESWPKLLELQRKYNSDIQIVLVNTTEPETNGKKMIDKWQKNKGLTMSLPLIFGNKKLRQYFPHTAIPHLIWIDKTGSVKYITSGSVLNAHNIEKFINNEQMNFSEKTDIYKEIIWNKPLFINGNGGNGAAVVYSSIISKRFEGSTATERFGIDKRDSSSYGVVSNAPVSYMLRSLFGGGLNKNGSRLWIPHARLMFKTKDSTRLVPKINGETRSENFITLQLTTKGEYSVQEIKKMMIADLCRYLKLNWQWKKITTKCLVISKSKSPIWEYKRGNKVIKAQPGNIDINNITVTELVEKLMGVIDTFFTFPYPVVDETDFTGQLGAINFECDVSDWRKLGKELNKYGLEFTLQEREVDVLVITDAI